MNKDELTDILHKAMSLENQWDAPSAREVLKLLIDTIKAINPEEPTND